MILLIFTETADVMLTRLVIDLISGPPVVRGGAASSKDRPVSNTEDWKGTFTCRNDVMFITPFPDARAFAAVNVMSEMVTDDCIKIADELVNVFGV